MIGIDSQENFVAYSKRFRFVKEALATAFPGRPWQSIRILDVGCGNGSQLPLSLARCGYDLTGIDLDPRSIEHARTLSAGMPNARFLAGKVEDLGEAPFDAVVLAEVLEHGRTALLVKPGDPDEVVEAIKRLAANERLRIELGRNARETALKRHTWRQDARRVLAYSSDTRPIPNEFSLPTAVAVSSSSPSTNLTEQNLR
jgi:SAM-dependent methyltransferase